MKLNRKLGRKVRNLLFFHCKSFLPEEVSLALATCLANNLSYHIGLLSMEHEVKEHKVEGLYFSLRDPLKMHSVLFPKTPCSPFLDKPTNGLKQGVWLKGLPKRSRILECSLAFKLPSITPYGSDVYS